MANYSETGGVGGEGGVCRAPGPFALPGGGMDGNMKKTTLQKMKSSRESLAQIRGECQ